MRKLWLLALIITVAGINSKAQEIKSHPKKIYISPDGKIFLNKSLPVYFYISDSPDPNARKYQLKSETTPKYTNPMYFDTEGKNTLRSPWAVDTVTRKQVYPKIDIEYQVYVDSKPPVSRIQFDKQKTNYKKGIFYTSDSLSVSFEATDAMSGVEDVYVSVDGDAYGPFKGTLNLDREKGYLIKYYSVDNTGNVEPLHEITLSVDKNPPVSKLKITGEEYENILPGNALLSIDASDSISGVKQTYISIDDSVFKPYSSKINTAYLSQGEHKLWYYSVDQVNNKENVSTYSFYVDKTPPQVIEEIQGKTFVANGKEFSAGTSRMKITSIDNKAGVKEIYYSINNEPFVKYEKPVVLSGYKGDVLVRSYAVDNVGNKGQSDVSNSRGHSIPYIDLGAPWVGHTFRGPQFSGRDTLFISHKTQIILEARDTESGIQKIEYQTDSSDLITYSSPFLLQKEGFHRISVYGYDNTENLTRQEFGVMVDSVGPGIYERFSSLPMGTVEADGKKLNVYPAQMVVFLSATDIRSGFESMFYQLNNGKLLPYTGAIKGFTAGKQNVIKVKAVDKLGNSTEKVIEFFVR